MPRKLIDNEFEHGRLVAADRHFGGLSCTCGRHPEHLPADACPPCSSRLVVNKTVEYDMVSYRMFPKRRRDAANLETFDKLRSDLNCSCSYRQSFVVELSFDSGRQTAVCRTYSSVSPVAHVVSPNHCFKLRDSVILRLIATAVK